MDGLQRLLDFADYLRSQRMPFVIGQQRDDALTLSFSTFGNRFVLDFSPSGMSCRRYRGSEDVFQRLDPVCAAIEAAQQHGAGAAEADAADEGAGEEDGMRRLLAFTQRLRRNGISFTIEQHSCDALEVSFSVAGRRIEVEFSVRETCYSVFEQEGIMVDAQAIRREVESFERPYERFSRVADWRDWMSDRQDRAG